MQVNTMNAAEINDLSPYPVLCGLILVEGAKATARAELQLRELPIFSTSLLTITSHDSRSSVIMFMFISTGLGLRLARNAPVGPGQVEEGADPKQHPPPQPHGLAQ